MFPSDLFSREELNLLGKLNTPNKIQNYLDSIPFNFEKRGETCMSPRCTMREKKAHCIEGGLLAAAALWMQGRKPLLLNLKVNKQDSDHIVALFQENGYWGAISKTNHAVLRYRDPVYKTVRELAMSFFHEYFLVSNGKKTMTGYSTPINLRRFGTRWLTEEKDLWNISETIYDLSHTDTVPGINKRLIRAVSKTERSSAKIAEWGK